MPATPARIGFIQSEFRKVQAKDTVVQSRFGSLARDSEDPVPTFFNNEADALLVAQERQTLLGQTRRRFSVRQTEAEDVAELDLSGTLPVVSFTDAEKAVARNMAVCSVSFDLGRGLTTVTLWG